METTNGDVLRPATVADVDAIATMHLRSATVGFRSIFPPEAPKPTHASLVDIWRAQLEADEYSVTTVCERNGAIIGATATCEDAQVAGLGHLARLYVDPDEWGTGVGTVLYRSAVQTLRATGFGRASLWVLEHNTRARTWYERLGWQLVPGTTPTWEAGGIIDVRYERRLDGDD
jgi:GNAT superfamily N-acetyltransferase